MKPGLPLRNTLREERDRRESILMRKSEGKISLAD
jgi:hypothetical protein